MNKFEFKDIGVGDTITVEMSNGQLNTWVVTARNRNIKNGKSGFDYGKGSWCYAEQVKALEKKKVYVYVIIDKDGKMYVRKSKAKANNLKKTLDTVSEIHQVEII